MRGVLQYCLFMGTRILLCNASYWAHHFTLIFPFQGVAMCLGRCASIHLDDVLEKLNEFVTTNIIKKESSYLNIFKVRRTNYNKNFVHTCNRAVSLGSILTETMR